MSFEDDTQTEKALPGAVKAWLIGGGAAVLAVVLALVLWRPSAAVIRTEPTKALQESELEAARQALTGDADAATCRQALQQINSHLGKEPRDQPPVLAPSAGDALHTVAGLDKGELEELAADHYTPLDARHLEFCLLLRDAARSLEVRGVGGEQPGPLERARVAFDWVVRQVRLARGAGVSTDLVPPDLVLRRGWGSEFDRALVFLCLLRQLGGPTGAPECVGALLSCPGADGKPRLWACGVACAGGRGLYLFDPRLGLPLPGPGGKGVATLQEVSTRPSVLAGLDVKGAPPYDVTAAQARKAELADFCPLSALSPRMRHLQEVLLPPVVEVRLAADLPGELERLRQASRPAKGADRAPPVTAPPGSAGLWRSFLPPDEGGTDRPGPLPVAAVPGYAPRGDRTNLALTHKQVFELDLVPWTWMPEIFRQFPYNVGLGSVVRGAFRKPFVDAVLSPGPRDMLLRGHHRKAASELVQDRDVWQERRKRLESAVSTEDGARQLETGVREWAAKAREVYADQLRAQTPEQKEAAARAVAVLWKEAAPIETLLFGAAAEPRLAELTYQLGLCTQEEAERLQARAAAAGASEGDREKARQAWEDALDWWKKCAEQHAARPEAPAARRLRGRAEEALGDPDAAAKTWQDVSGPMTDLEKLASLYRARQLSRAGGG
jgi:hypothetical protein